MPEPLPTSTGAPLNLWAAVRSASERARDAGALQPISTRQVYLEDGGVRFLVRVIDSLAHKPKAHAHSANPFLPYDPQMYVAEISPNHIGLLNKFQVVDQHLLVVTRSFEPQESPLTLADFEALAWCLSSAATEREGLVFYNAGAEAGASQPHKHLQLVPLPLDSDPAFPFEPLLREGAGHDIYSAPRLPLAHSSVQLPNPLQTSTAVNAHEIYMDMLQRHALWRPGEHTTLPYNLLITRELMWLVPRLREAYGDISLNSLAFAGALLVKNDEQLKLLAHEGPWTALRHVTRPV